MRIRTKNKLFTPCPICGKMPYVSYYQPNSGFATCHGTIFHPHDLIRSYVQWEEPSNVVRKLSEKWNSGQFLNFEKLSNET